MKKYLVSFLLVALLVVPFVGQGATLAELLAQLASLQKQIAALTNQTTTPVCQFTHDLSLGDGEGDGLTREISALQKVLISGGYLNIIKPTGYFGKLTTAAVKLWQNAKVKGNFISGSIGRFQISF